MEPDTNDQGSQLIEQQIEQNNIELEQKRKAITDERFSIIKSQGAANWSPSPPPTYGAKNKSTQQQDEQTAFVERYVGKGVPR